MGSQAAALRPVPPESAVKVYVPAPLIHVVAAEREQQKLHKLDDSEHDSKYLRGASGRRDERLGSPGSLRRPPSERVSVFFSPLQAGAFERGERVSHAGVLT